MLCRGEIRKIYIIKQEILLFIEDEKFYLWFRDRDNLYVEFKWNYKMIIDN